jgi:hypothetical protein
MLKFFSKFLNGTINNENKKINKKKLSVFAAKNNEIQELNYKKKSKCHILYIYPLKKIE